MCGVFAGAVENDNEHENEDDWRGRGPRLTIVVGSGFKRRQHWYELYVFPIFGEVFVQHLFSRVVRGLCHDIRNGQPGSSRR